MAISLAGLLPSGPVSPVVQIREMLVEMRGRDVPFEAAWHTATQQVKWPHDTTHRREWKGILGVERPPDWSCVYFERCRTQTLDFWRAAYCRWTVRAHEAPLTLIAA